MTITAKFSNGFEDTYKGHRNVKAAWVVCQKSDGKVIASGHSMDRVKAAKTARSNMSYKAWEGQSMPTRAYPGVEKILRRHGYAGPKSTSAMMSWSRAQNAKRLEVIEANHTVEIIDL